MIDLAFSRLNSSQRNILVKKVKLKERFKKVFEAFFENDETDSTHLEKMSVREIAKESNQKTWLSIFNLLRQIFLFFPGTFMTFFLWMEISAVGHIPYYSILFWILLLIPPFLMVLGMGNVTKLKHWLMPLNVIILGAFLGFTLSLFPAVKYILASNANVLMLFPLALITAILSKNWADNSANDK